MEVDCEGCAGCCLDWRSIAPDRVELDHERRGAYVPLDGTYNLAPLSGDEIRRYLRMGLADAATPRLFAAEEGLSVGGRELAAIDGRPAFLVGLRKPLKPVAPFGTDPTWLPSCVFLDPTTLQCRVHGDDAFPDACGTYPADNLSLGAETECERVESAIGGERLLDDDPVDADPLVGPGALGARVFAHPDPDRIADAIERIVSGEPTDSDRAEFVAVAAASRPGSLTIDDDRYDAARERALSAGSWVGRSIGDWERRAAAASGPDPALAAAVEDARGAPPTDGWD